MCPFWADLVITKRLTIIGTSDDHLLGQVFGSYSEGRKIVQTASELPLAKLGFVPYSPCGTPTRKKETQSLLRRWTELIPNETEH